MGLQWYGRGEHDREEAEKIIKVFNGNGYLAKMMPIKGKEGRFMVFARTPTSMEHTEVLKSIAKIDGVDVTPTKKLDKAVAVIDAKKAKRDKAVIKSEADRIASEEAQAKEDERQRYLKSKRRR